SISSSLSFFLLNKQTEKKLEQTCSSFLFLLCCRPFIHQHQHHHIFEGKATRGAEVVLLQSCSINLKKAGESPTIHLMNGCQSRCTNAKEKNANAGQMDRWTEGQNKNGRLQK